MGKILNIYFCIIHVIGAWNFDASNLEQKIQTAVTNIFGIVEYSRNGI
jgi:hypothetical protein